MQSGYSEAVLTMRSWRAWISKGICKKGRVSLFLCALASFLPAAPVIAQEDDALAQEKRKRPGASTPVAITLPLLDTPTEYHGADPEGRQLDEVGQDPDQSDPAIASECALQNAECDFDGAKRVRHLAEKQNLDRLFPCRAPPGTHPRILSY